MQHCNPSTLSRSGFVNDLHSYKLRDITSPPDRRRSVVLMFNSNKPLLTTYIDLLILRTTFSYKGVGYSDLICCQWELITPISRPAAPLIRLHASRNLQGNKLGPTTLFLQYTPHCPAGLLSVTSDRGLSIQCDKHRFLRSIEVQTPRHRWRNSDAVADILWRFGQGNCKFRILIDALLFMAEGLDNILLSYLQFH